MGLNYKEIIMIYFLEDDKNIRDFVLYTLNAQGFKAMGFERPSIFWNAMDEETPSLILLDIMLPEEDGLSILRKLRGDKATAKLPVIMLTAKGTEFDKVIGLDSGADDYIPKPFSMMELLSRIKALLRRTQETSSELEYIIDSLYVCPEKRIVKVDGESVSLTYKEFELLCYLLENKNIVLNRTQILNKIWNYDFDGESRTVDVHIRTLRQKLGNASEIIKTVRGVGYKIGTKK